MRVTQGAFSFLPDLTDAQIRSQIEYCLQNNWAVSIEYTDDPHPRNTYWEMFGNPMFDIRDAAGIMGELQSCRKTFPQTYIKINAFDSSHGRESLRLSFIVNRPDRLSRVLRESFSEMCREGAWFACILDRQKTSLQDVFRSKVATNSRDVRKLRANGALSIWHLLGISGIIRHAYAHNAPERNNS